MKKSKLWLLFFFTASILSGCGNLNTSSAPSCRVVTQVDITCQHEDLLIERHYTDLEKMTAVLLYVRLMKPLQKPEIDPNTLDADIYQITLHLSNGKERIYRQKAHRYISKDSGPWKTLDSAHAAQLYALMRAIPSDPAL